MLWARLVAYLTGMVKRELPVRNEYLGAEKRILRGQIKCRLLLSEGEKATLAEIAQRLGRKALEELAAVVKPDTVLAPGAVTAPKARPHREPAKHGRSKPAPNHPWREGHGERSDHPE
jgi:hypothetical protein